MDTKRHLLKISGNILFLSVILLSCRTTEKTAVSCPEFSNNKNRVAGDHKSIQNKVKASHFTGTTRKQDARLSRKNLRRDLIDFKTGAVQDEILYSGTRRVSDLTKTECLKGLITSTKFPISIVESNSITPRLMKRTGVKWQSDNYLVNHSTGGDTIVSSDQDYNFKNTSTDYNKTAITETRYGIPWFVYVLAGLFVFSGLFVFGLPGLLYALIALGLMGLVFNGITRIKRTRNPDKLKGKRSETGNRIIELVVVAGVVLGLMLLIFYLMFILAALV